MTDTSHLTDKDKKRVAEGRDPGPLHVGQLPPKAEIAARGAGDAGEPKDGKFRRVFVLQEFDPKSDHSLMHEANKLVTIQEAMARGLAPQSEADFEGHKEVGRKNIELTYSVPVVLATVVGKPAVTPSTLLKKNDNSTTAATGKK